MLTLMLAQCTYAPPQPSGPTLTATPSLSRHLLIEVTGNLNHKRTGWKEYLPLSFGVSLDQDDLLQAAGDAKGLIVCADLSLARIPSGYHGGVPCPQTQPILVRGDSLVVEPRRNTLLTSSIPYIISPRYTFIQTPQPAFKWHPSNSGNITYAVQIQGKDLIWSMEVTTTELVYPISAPALVPDTPYRLTVVGNNGHSSTEEQTAVDLSFVLLSPDKVTTTRELAGRIQGIGLNQQAVYFTLAEIYATQGLRADAIALLEKMAFQSNAPAVDHRLADLYREVGLYIEAQVAYEQALHSYQTLGDTAGEAATLAGLGIVCRASGDDAAAQDRLMQALKLYQTIGDAKGISWVETVLAEIK